MTDQEILSAFHQEETKEWAFGRLLDKYQEKLYWHLRRMTQNHEDADDLMQNTFLKVWTGLHHFRADSQLYTWLYRIATNEAINLLNQKSKRATLSFDASAGQDDEGFSPSAYLGTTGHVTDGDEIQKKLEMAIAGLPDKQRIVFQMRYFDEMSYEQISEVLGTSVGALKASYHHAAVKIEQYIRKTD